MNSLVRDRILRSDFTCLPLVRSKSYSIFLSSTFQDTQFERNEIMAKVKPVLGELNKNNQSGLNHFSEEFTKSINFDFHFVDLRWGIR